MKRRGVTIILIITICAVFFYGYRYLKIPVETKTARITRLEDVISCNAYISRQETVYSAERTGTMYSYVTEGARVAKNMKIATVYQGNADNDLIQELNNIDIKVAELEKKKEESEHFTGDYGSVESTMETIKNKIITAAIENDIADIGEYKASINSLYSNGADNYADTISGLNTRKTEIESQLGNNKSDIYSTISGIYSENVDGLEGILTLESIMQYTVADFNSLSYDGANARISNSVNASDTICKVVDNHVWYAVTVIPKAKAHEIKNDKNLLIRFDSLPGEEVAAEVVYISQEAEEEENVLIVLKSERYLEGVYGIREGKMEIVVSRYTGFEVPVYAVRIIDDKKGVLISKGTSEIFCECDIIYTDEEKGTAIVYPSSDAKRKLSIGDKIILGEKTE